MRRSRRALLPTLRAVRRVSRSQLRGHAQLRVLRFLLPRLPLTGTFGDEPSAAPGWPPSFSPVSTPGFEAADVDAFERGEFSFFGDRSQLGEPPDWKQPGASALWRYHLHYFDWIWAFTKLPRGEAGERFAAVYRSWSTGSRFGEWDAWAPYPVSVRSWNLCAAHPFLVRGTALEAAIHSELQRHAWHLRHNLEVNHGGNHLVKNLKALFGLSAHFGDEQHLDRDLRRFCLALERQILADGGHVERSTAYHAQVLEDTLDVQRLAIACGVSPPASMEDAILRQQAWLSALHLPHGVPVFGDGWRLGPEYLEAIGCGATDPVPLQVFAESGFVVVHSRRGDVAVAISVGPTKLNGYAPGHAHADCLSFELGMEGRPVVVDPGSSTYEPGELRSFERSTQAHATVMVDRRDQSELFGAFRVGRQARGRLLRCAAGTDGEVCVEAEHDGYGSGGTPVRHSRRWEVRSGALEIVDRLEGTGSHHLSLSLPLAEGRLPTADPSGIQLDGLTIRTPCELAVTIADSHLAVRQGERRSSLRIVSEGVVDLPAELRTLVTLT